jgi:alpha-L-fucosidase
LECDARLRKDWGFHHNLEENPLKSLEELMDMYYGSVGRGAVLLINQALHPQGHILLEDMARMKEFGEEIRRRFAHPIVQGGGAGHEFEVALGEGCCQCQKQQTCQSRAGQEGKKGVFIDHIALSEDIRQGQRVRAYRVEGLAEGAWRTLSAGTAIGYKKLDWFPALPVEKLKVRVLESVGLPMVSLKAYHAGVTPAPGVVRTARQALLKQTNQQLSDKEFL